MLSILQGKNTTNKCFLLQGVFVFFFRNYEINYFNDTKNIYFMKRNEVPENCYCSLGLENPKLRKYLFRTNVIRALVRKKPPTFLPI